MNTENPNSPKTISFIIPALNESEHIGNTIEAIHRALAGDSFDYEIIVIDNGSNDDTEGIAQQHGAKTFVEPALNISGLRNFGVEQSKGDTLIFLDADVSIADDWLQHFKTVLSKLSSGEKLVTGSHCAPPDSDIALHAHWFNALYQDERNTHIGSAHMIMSRQSFLDIGGFDVELETGEDYDICNRAKISGHKIHNNPELKVIHHDFPADLSSFVKREAWHGRSDFATPSSWMQSKVAVAATLFFLLHCALLVFLFSNLLMAAVTFILIVCLLLLSSIFKFRNQSMKTVLINTGLFYFYYIGRVMSFFTRKTGTGSTEINA